jgi:hypothetical protein
MVRKKKTMDFLMARGFEMDLIRKAVEDKSWLFNHQLPFFPDHIFFSSCPDK